MLSRLSPSRRAFVWSAGLAITALCAACSLLDLDGTPPAGPALVQLPGDDLYPEGILAAPNGDVFVSGFGNGSIVRVTNGAEAGYFRPPGADGLASAVGMALDARRGWLWVSNFDFGTGQSALLVFDADTGALVATLAPEADGRGHFFNEVAIDADGRVYVSDTLTPTIWTAGPDLGGVEVFVEDERLMNPRPERPFGLNGLALSPDGGALIASVMDRITQGGGRLVRIDRATRTVSEVALDGAPEALAAFGGSDGMFFEPDGRLVMVNVTPPAALYTATFSDDFAGATLVAHDRFEAAYNRPTASALRDGRLWTVNSQLDHIIDDENGALGTPPELPFGLVHVPFAEALRP